MRHRAPTQIYLCSSCRQLGYRPRRLDIAAVRARRDLHIGATPSSAEPPKSFEASSLSNSADARFEVLGTPFSLLSAQIAASQKLYTRKGTLVGFSGKLENTFSTLSLLEPFRRAALGIPFIYQRVASTTPYTALISTKSPLTSLVVVHLDGRRDWMIAQRNALLAWTGHTLKLSPQWNMNMSLASWGSTVVTGRGLLALSGKGLIHQITLKTGEDYAVHPGNLIAYSIMQHAPQPYRFKSSRLRLQIPNPFTRLPDTRFWRIMREHTLWKLFRDAAFTVRTWARKTIWGDGLFLRFHGPTTILVSSRAAALTDVLTTRDINEIADSPAGSVPAALHTSSVTKVGTSAPVPPIKGQETTTTTYASVDTDGNVKFNK